MSSFANFKINQEFPSSELRPQRQEGQLYIDVIFITYKKSGLRWKDIKKKFQGSIKHYQKAGVNLNLKRAVEVVMGPKYQKHLANEINGIDPRQGTQPYQASQLRKISLHKRAKRVFEKLSYLSDAPARTLFVVVSKGIFYKAFFNREGERIVLNKGVQGFSFPAYSFEDRIPLSLRGFVSILPSAGARTLSHEFGHKLINVSHEGLDACPQFDGGGIPGLMGYGRSTEIFSGRKGRFHKERLHLSPFIYKIVNGEKVHNPDYEEFGHYRDPIYAGMFLTPECP